VLAAPVRRIGDSLVVPLTRGTGGPRVALAGHLDVVRTDHEGPPRVDGDRVFGPGSSDMKSGLALLLDLVEGERIDGVDLTLVFYAREEGPFADNELGPVLEAEPALSAVDLAVCLEPSDNKLSLGASGSLHAEVVFEGKTAHSARPWQGDNAIHKAGAFLTELSRLEPEEVVVDGLLYRAVTSATLADGGRGRNVVPDRFKLNVNHRFPPGRSPEQAQEDLRALVGDRARVTFTDVSPSALPFASHPLVVALRESGVAAVEPKQAWTDVARFAALGVPAVNFGPGDNAQAHQRNESTSAAALLEGRRILRRWLGRIATR
jgi:succinyl-diaminopimelate desuccinylase